MQLQRTADHCFDSLLTLVYPQPCAVCGASVESRSLGCACKKCWEATRIFSSTETVCWKCGVLAAGDVAPEKREDVRCHRCDTDAFTAARSCGVYEKALRASVLLLKREPHRPRRLAQLLLEVQKQNPMNQASRIVPVPLHSQREKARGFNQAAIIARELSRLTKLSMDEVSVVRSHHTERHRAGMDARGRRETVADAFRVVHPALIAGERILLVDDVFTTGATVSACAASLIDAGAAEVYVLTLARPRSY